MLSYLIVIIRPKTLAIDCTHMKRLTDMKTYRWTQKQNKKISKNQNCLFSMLVLKIEYLYYSLNVEGVTRKGSLLPAHIR